MAIMDNNIVLFLIVFLLLFFGIIIPWYLALLFRKDKKKFFAVIAIPIFTILFIFGALLIVKEYKINASGMNAYYKSHLRHCPTTDILFGKNCFSKLKKASENKFLIYDAEGCPPGYECCANANLCGDFTYCYPTDYSGDIDTPFGSCAE